MKTLLPAVLSLWALAGEALATCPQRRVVIHNAAVVTPIVTSAFVPVYVPQYGTGYDPNPDVQALRQELQEIKQLFRKQQTVPPVPLQQKSSRSSTQDALTAYASVVKAKCAACHHDSNAKAKGAGLILTQGANYAPAKLSDKAIWKMLTKTHTNQMPLKGEPLTDDEYSTLVDAAKHLEDPEGFRDEGDQVRDDVGAAGQAAGLVCCPTTPHVLVLRRRVVVAAAVTPFVPAFSVQALVPLAVAPAVQLKLHAAAVAVKKATLVRIRFAVPARPLLAAPRLAAPLQVGPLRSAFRGGQINQRTVTRTRGR